jgi:hypothetical protein
MAPRRLKGTLLQSREHRVSVSLLETLLKRSRSEALILVAFLSSRRTASANSPLTKGAMGSITRKRIEQPRTSWVPTPSGLRAERVTTS